VLGNVTLGLQIRASGVVRKNPSERDSQQSLKFVS
jgi:hypothetical protein